MELAGLKFELCAKNIHSSKRHVSSCASQYTEHQHKFSLTFLSCVTVVYFSDPRPVCLRIHLSDVKIHDRMVLLRNTNFPHSESIEFGPCISTGTVKACALFGLHMMAEEKALRSDSGSSVSEGTDALDVIGLHGSGDKISLFLQDWDSGKGGIKLPHGPQRLVPGNV